MPDLPVGRGGSEWRAGETAEGRELGQARKQDCVACMDGRAWSFCCLVKCGKVIAKEPENTRAGLKTPVGPGSKVLGCARVSTKQSVLKTVQKNTARHRAFGYRAHTLLTGQELRIEYYA